MTTEQIEEAIKHLATKEQLAELRAQLAELKADLQTALRTQFYWTTGIIIAVQVPTWIAIGQLWVFLSQLAMRLPLK